MYKLAAIVGPTASGKSALALKVAARLGGEIINCDSMQVYRGMDIGTAKASRAERRQVPHHLMDIVDIAQDFNVARYQDLAKEVIADINQRGKLPLMVGGTGLYYQAVVDNYHFFPLESQSSIRHKWDKAIEECGIERVFKELQKIDPEYSDVISGNDRKRIVRALEVYELTGKPFSTFQQHDKYTYNLAAVGLLLPRQGLYHRIDQRVEQMIEQGLIEEVLQLTERPGYSDDLNSMQALGYKQVTAYLHGFIDQDVMIDEIKRETRRLAKRQITWFKRDQRIFWIEVGDDMEEDIILEKICTYIEGRLHSV